MSTPQVQQSDIGIALVIKIVDQSNVAVDVSSAATIEFLFQKPDGTFVTVIGEFATDGTDGRVRYVTEANDLDIPGTWKYQTHVVMGPVSLYSTVGKFKVKSNLPIV